MVPVALAFKALPALAAAQMFDLEVDIGAIVKWGVRLTRAAHHLGGEADAINQRALDEMVELARSRAPERTGRLRQGITGTHDGETFVFAARAQASRGGKEGADYAPFVERGTRGGLRGARFERRTDGERGRAIAKSRRTHPGTEAQPFFYVSAREVLARWRKDQSAAYARQVAETVEE